MKNAIAIANLCLLFLVVATARGQTSRPDVSQIYPPINPHLPTFWIIGDSTVRNGHDNGNNGQWGWGHPIASFFDINRINVQNRALGGTSSRSYYANQWPTVAAMIQPGDYLIMQFGHNDTGKPDEPTRARASLPGVGDQTLVINNPLTKKKETVHTFGWYLRQFIAEAKAKGVKTIIVCSLTPRDNFENGKLVRNTRFEQWDSQVAKEAGVDYIDLNELAGEKYDAAGPQKVADTYFPVGEKLHPDWAGAILNAQCVVDGIKSLSDSDLKTYLLPNAPTTLPLPEGKAR